MRNEPELKVKITLTVVAFSNDATVHACCNSLLQQQYDLTRYDVFLRVLVNDTNRVSIFLLKNKYPQFEIIEPDDNVGYAGAIERCWKDADGGIIVVTNDDITFDQNWLEKLFEPFSDQNVFATTCSIINDGESEEISNDSLNPFGTRISNVFSDRRKVLFPSGAAFAFRKDEIEPVDPSYFLYYEDVYLGLKARLRGFEIVMNPESKAYHRHQLSTSGMNRGMLHYYQEKNRLANLLLFLQGKTLLKLIPYILADFILRLVMIIGLKRRFDGMLCAWLYYITHTGTTLSKRLKIGRVRTVSDDAVLKYMSGKLLPGNGKIVSIINRIFLAYARIVKLNFAEFSESGNGK